MIIYYVVFDHGKIHTPNVYINNIIDDNNTNNSYYIVNNHLIKEYDTGSLDFQIGDKVIIEYNEKNKQIVDMSKYSDEEDMNWQKKVNYVYTTDVNKNTMEAFKR